MTAPNPLQQLGIPARDADLIALDARDWRPMGQPPERGWWFKITHGGVKGTVGVKLLADGRVTWCAGIGVDAWLQAPITTTPVDVAFALHTLATGSREHAAAVG